MSATLLSAVHVYKAKLAILSIFLGKVKGHRSYEALTRATAQFTNVPHVLQPYCLKC